MYTVYKKQAGCNKKKRCEDTMKQNNSVIIDFKKAAQSCQNRQTGLQYDCYMTRGRLSGHCDLLISEKSMQTAEWFCLSFAPDGLTRHSYLHQRNRIQEWITQRGGVQITYLQALGLLGDAVRQNYKYRQDNNWIHNHMSIHLQRIWMDEYYNDRNSDLGWILCKQDAMGILQIYLRAVGNKDAALIYDMSAERAKNNEKRGMYTFCWNHVLEDLTIFDFKVEEIIQNREAEDYTFFLTVYGAQVDNRVLSVDLSLRIILEQGYFRILRERILEARLIYRDCAKKALS